MLRILSFIALLTLGGAFFWSYTYVRENQTAPLQIKEPQFFTINKGEAALQVLKRLHDGNTIQMPLLLFKFLAKLSPETYHFQAGEYELLPGETLETLFAKFRTGEHILYPLTVPEGLLTADIVELIAKADFLEGELPEAEITKETLLLPETYHFARGTSRRAVFKRMEKACHTLLEKLWETRPKDHFLKTKEDLLIFASIVEKESKLDGERPLIASVFLNRLEKGMPLQADSTLSYGFYLSEGRQINQGLSREDLKTPSPYNTYLNTGLPPAAICHPGRASLEASLTPEKTDYLYFVADGTGGHVFAKDYLTHKRNHQKWRKIRAEIKKAQAKK